MRSRASAFDQASAILDSNSREAWGETTMRPREWELVFPSQYGDEIQYGGEFTIANLKKTPALQAAACSLLESLQVKRQFDIKHDLHIAQFKGTHD